MPQLEPSALLLPPAQLDELRALLARHVPDAEVWAYGSRVTGGAHEGSDLDLVLRKPDDLGLAVQGQRALIAALQQSRLPMQVEAHQWPHLPRSFQAEIERAFVVLQTPQNTPAC